MSKNLIAIWLCSKVLSTILISEPKLSDCDSHVPSPRLVATLSLGESAEGERILETSSILQVGRQSRDSQDSDIDQEQDKFGRKKWFSLGRACSNEGSQSTTKGQEQYQRCDTDSENMPWQETRS